MKNRAFDYSKWPNWIDPADVTPYENNAKDHPEEQVRIIANSIKRFGWQQDCAITRDNVVVIGHGRRLAAMQIGCKMPYHRVDKDADELTEEEIKALRLADNKTNESEWIFEALNPELIALNAADIDMQEFGFDDIPRGGIEEQNAEEDDYDIAAPVEPRAKLGDIYQLGRHRLMCGDSTDAEMVARLMDGEKADMVFTDPPYGVEYTGGIQFKADHVEKNNREMIIGDDVDIYGDAIKRMSEFVDGPCYIWFAGTKAKSLYDAAEAYGTIHALIIWVKNGGYGALNANYKQKHEPCLYWNPRGTTLRFCGNTTENTVWVIDKDGVNQYHPTQKPVALAAKAIANHAAHTVLDLFGGSGTTLIACEKLRRACYMMELDPHYVDVIISRWEALTGEKAVLLNA